MIELQGKFNTSKVFTDVVDNASISQIIELCNQEFTSGEKIRMMPDVHAGAGCTIGTTMTITDKIVPNLVGVDIGCGMETVLIKEQQIDLQQIDNLIHERIPSGCNIRNHRHKYVPQINLKELKCVNKINIDRAKLSLGTLGGGNHFIEADKGADGIYIVVHSGSRHLGVEVAKYYQEKGYEQLNQTDNNAIKNLVADLKSQGRETEINDAIKNLKATTQTSIPKHLAYVSGQLFDDYIHDMKIIQQYAMLNRKAIMDEIISGLNLTVVDQFTTIHNYIDTDNMILRKGSVSSQAGEKLIIPINMRDGSLICIGKGNPDWNYSAPHGAGRIMSRSQAKEQFTVDEFAEEMTGIYSTSINQGTLDECPMAYKNIDDIVNNISDTVEIIEVIKPIYNFKASGD